MGPMKATSKGTIAHLGGFFAASSSKDLPRPRKCLPDMKKIEGSAGGHLDYVLPLQLAGNIFFLRMDKFYVSVTKISLDTSISRTSISGRREY